MRRYYALTKEDMLGAGVPEVVADMQLQMYSSMDDIGCAVLDLTSQVMVALGSPAIGSPPCRLWCQSDIDSHAIILGCLHTIASSCLGLLLSWAPLIRICRTDRQ